MARNATNVKPAAEAVETVETPVASNGEASTRERNANHEWVTFDDAGAPVAADKIENATGISYTDLVTDELFTFNLANADGATMTMLALFGARTLATNTASQISQAVKRGEDPGMSRVEAITERFGEFDGTRWAAPREGAGGPRYIAATLAAAIAEAKGEEDATRYLARINDEEGYGAKAMKVDAVRSIYTRLRGKAAPTLSDI